ncbi:MAG: RnfABCDGE type electron transport complex subunit D [Bacteroidales bacterium]|nr:RnfABCDGE type electron transport complex subunit D [Bacteroidales bacterium]
MKKLLVSPSPHIHSSVSTKTIMRDVVIALAPAVICAFLFYGWYSLAVMVVSVAASIAIEWAVAKWLLKSPDTPCLWASAVTGLLLALSLPPSIPLWIVLIGDLFAIGVVKMTFGGLGQNIFNPAIAARVFLLISFPVQMTDWTVCGGIISPVDDITGATLLGVMSEGGDVMALSSLDLGRTFFYNIGGSAGEISALAFLLGFAYLLIRKVITPLIPLTILGTAFIFGWIFFAIDPTQYVNPFINILAGGMLLGSIFMATDYVTSPMSESGCVIYGVGIGLITMLIRYFGAYPEGISFAILFMNALVPLIDRACHRKKFGRT